MENWAKIYMEAVYVVFFEDVEIRFKIDEHSDEIEHLLTHCNAETFAFLTAYNPLSKKLLDDENEARQRELISILQSQNYQFLKGFGTNEDESWEREESVFIVDITEETALEIARSFEQHAIVFGEKVGLPRLIWC